jgi:uncharacterized membrane protein
VAESRPGWTDEQVEQLVGRLLQAGVMLSAGVVLLGAIVYLIQHGGERPNYRVFHGEPAALRTFLGIGDEALHFHDLGLIQFGLLLLIATPVARVALTVYAFLRQRDHVYTAVTLFVLGVLVYSLLSGYVKG